MSVYNPARRRPTEPADLSAYAYTDLHVGGRVIDRHVLVERYKGSSRLVGYAEERLYLAIKGVAAVTDRS